MKIWNAYGSEHSMNLVMVGKFRDAGSAESAKDAIEELQAYFSEKEPDGDVYSPEAMELLRRLQINTVGSKELEQFRYDFRIKTERESVVITTDEIEVSGLFKVLLDRGARLEIYSAHEYPNEKHGRGK